MELTHASVTRFARVEVGLDVGQITILAVRADRAVLAASNQETAGLTVFVQTPGKEINRLQVFHGIFTGEPVSTVSANRRRITGTGRCCYATVFIDTVQAFGTDDA